MKNSDINFFISMNVFVDITKLAKSLFSQNTLGFANKRRIKIMDYNWFLVSCHLKIALEKEKQVIIATDIGCIWGTELKYSELKKSAIIKKIIESEIKCQEQN